jgi:hypothetical protein
MEQLPEAIFLELLNLLTKRKAFNEAPIKALFRTSAVIRRKFLHLFLERLVFLYDGVHYLWYSNAVKHVRGLSLMQTSHLTIVPAAVRTLSISCEKLDMVERFLSTLSQPLEQLECLVKAATKQKLDLSTYPCLGTLNFLKFKVWKCGLVPITLALPQKLKTLQFAGVQLEELPKSLEEFQEGRVSTLHQKREFPAGLKLFHTDSELQVKPLLDALALTSITEIKICSASVVARDIHNFSRFPHLRIFHCEVICWYEDPVEEWEASDFILKMHKFTALEELAITLTGDQGLVISPLPPHLRIWDAGVCGIEYAEFQKNQTIQKLTCPLNVFRELLDFWNETTHTVYLREQEEVAAELLIAKETFRLPSVIESLVFLDSFDEELKQGLNLEKTENLKFVAVPSDNKTKFLPILKRLHSDCEVENTENVKRRK